MIPKILQDEATARWVKDISLYLPVKSHFVLHGNIRDHFAFPVDDVDYDLLDLKQYLVESLHQVGYRNFLSVDPVRGLTLLFPSTATESEEAESLNWFNKQAREEVTFSRQQATGRISAEASFALAVEICETLIANRDTKTAIFFDYLMGQSESGETKEHVSFIRSLIQSYEAKPVGNDSFASFNTVFWCCDRDNDLPPWFALNNPRIRSVNIPKPDLALRRIVCAYQLKSVQGFDSLSAEEKKKVEEEFASQTEGMMLRDIQPIAKFCREQGSGALQIGDAAKRYKLGITEDPWKKIGKDKVEDTQEILRKRVKGQEAAIMKTMDILRRALSGLSGAQASKSSGKPKGVLFFAGPTGTGKTELAKSLTEGLFGDERSYIRFDMSEFNHEHSDQRLVGAPPGYLGFEAGGELTDAIKEKPFAVVLFDEIEKAHHKILDKFLQILDDGQLTSGKGERVYFSEAIIIFTSNLGMDQEGDTALRVSSEDDYPTLEAKLRSGVTRYFKEELNRPELLNRIGDNIVVFDFIRPEVAFQIMHKMVDNILSRIKESLGVEVLLSGHDPQDPYAVSVGAYHQLAKLCTENLTDGGRGIGNKLESFLINPLSRELYERSVVKGGTVVIESVNVENAVPRLEVRVE
jgi:ATP-dependent Clp protease ATP-binding subunit ClpA